MASMSEINPIQEMINHGVHGLSDEMKKELNKLIETSADEMTEEMTAQLKKYWWIIALTGVASAAVGTTMGYMLASSDSSNLSGGNFGSGFGGL